MQRLLISALLAGAMVSGCATKRYPMMTQFSEEEASAMTCRELAIELGRAEQAQAQIRDTARTDWRSAAGFLVDFGIGNAMARSDADKAVTRRILDIRSAQGDKSCLSQ